MPAPVSVYHRFITSKRGIAATEFAMVLPVMVIMLLATFDGARALAVYMKVRAATYTVAAITNQYSINAPITSADMTAITIAASSVLAPYPSAPVVVVVSQLAISAAGQTTAKVDWSATLNGSALAVGTPLKLPAGIASATNTCGSYPCYLIVSQVSYTYTPSFGYFTVGGITLSDTEFVTPRSSVCIPYVPQTGTTCP